MVGVSGGKFPAIRQHLQSNIAEVYKDMDITYGTVATGKKRIMLNNQSDSILSRMKTKLILRLVSAESGATM